MLKGELPEYLQENIQTSLDAVMMTDYLRKLVTCTCFSLGEQFLHILGKMFCS